jgi:hypothetical protein
MPNSIPPIRKAESIPMIRPMRFPVKKQTSALEKAEKAVSLAESVDSQVEKGLSISRKITSFIKSVTHVSSKAANVVASTKVTGGIPGLFAIPKFFSKVADIFRKKKKEEKARAFGGALLSGKDIVMSAAQMAEGLQKAGAVAKEAVKWTAPAGTWLLPLEALSLGIDTVDLWKAAKFKKKLGPQEQQPIPPQYMRSKRMLAALSALEELKAEGLVKRLSVTPPHAKELYTKISTLIARLKTTNQVFQRKALTDAEQLLVQIKGRVRKQITLNKVNLALKIIGIGLGVLMFFSPASPILLGFAAVGALVGLGFGVYRYYHTGQKLRLSPLRA